MHVPACYTRVSFSATHLLEHHPYVRVQVAAQRREYLKQLVLPEEGPSDSDSQADSSDSDAESLDGQLTCRSVVSQPWSRPSTAKGPRKRQLPALDELASQVTRLSCVTACEFCAVAL